MAVTLKILVRILLTPIFVPIMTLFMIMMFIFDAFYWALKSSEEKADFISKEFFDALKKWFTIP